MATKSLLTGRLEPTKIASPAQSLSADCIRVIIEQSLEYDDKGVVDVCPILRLRLVSRTFEIEVMHLICLTGLLWEMKGSQSINELHQVAKKRDKGSRHCVTSIKGNAAAFLARYMVMQPRDVEDKWNANMVTVVNAVIDHIMADDGLELDAAERYKYVLELCKNALPIAQGHDCQDFGIWDLFSPHGRSLIFPKRGIVTEASFETHIILAQIYLKRPDTVSKLRTLLLEKGRKPLSTFSTKHKKDQPLFGCFLEAAIKTRNLDLLSFLLMNDIDITVPRKKVEYAVVKKSKKPFYDGYFLHLAVYAGDVEAVETLIQRRIRHNADPESLVLGAVCSGHTEIARALMNHCFPTTNHADVGVSHVHQRRPWRIGEKAIREACHHRDSRTISAILSCFEKENSPRYIKSWAVQQPFRVFSHYWASRRFLSHSFHSDEQSEIKVCIDNGDMASLKLLLKNGECPHTESSYMNGNAHVFAVETQERGPMPATLPLWMCATEKNSNTVQKIMDAGYSGTVKEWLSVASMFSGAPRIVAAVVEPCSSQHLEDEGRDIRWQSIWEWMVRSGDSGRTRSRVTHC
ncbi:hypothetical protein EDB81DRAFT_910860 [Dactylonectria macrodidyma]|uniref:Uncharacterized protein n=1 Tax=Dactylonectria macrodidyma TaxID=307937 RepID=A0A9P9IMR7_9HYPO|nr:hypothetical protein EDB81DRAFT_910860 [Dactylonectria macrodidyma]